MNKHLRIGFVLMLLLCIMIVAKAAPPDPPITVRGFVFNLLGSQVIAGTNVSINDTNRSEVRYTATSGPNSTTTGFYQVDVNGTNGDLIRATAYNATHFGYNSSNATSNVANINITINDTRLSAPVLVSPANGTFTTTKAPTFVWNNSFDRVNNTGMVRNYTLEISNYASFTQEFADPPLLLFNVSGINETNAINTTYNLSFDLNAGTWYWRVRAFQLNTSAVSNYSGVFNLTILTVVACNLPTSGVDFGVLGLNRSNDTLDDSPRPLVIKSSGNIPENISINASNLWNDSNAQNPSRFYQWKITDNATGSFTAANTTTFLNMSTTAQRTIEGLRYTNASFPAPAARIELNITAPAQEPPGSKTSNILLTCEG